jgi:methylthioribose-1-phosphate isomerase
MVDQRLLPEKELYPCYTTYQEVAEAIKTMVVRGAPAIGVAAAMGIALGIRQIQNDSDANYESRFEEICQTIEKTRPTAVNLFWAVRRMRELFQKVKDKDRQDICRILEEEAIAVYHEDIAINKKMGQYGQELLPRKGTILTHCNAGALATAGYGTALGVIRAAREAGKEIEVLADETRPFLQGARLTAWELAHDGIPVKLLCDNMAGWMMQRGKIDGVIVGADRIAANGDTANKIGTYSVAVLAKENQVPFYVAAPISTLDLSLASGSEIPIEERDPAEVTHFQGKRVAPTNVSAHNPAFDVTPHRYIAAIITERGVAKPSFQESLAVLAAGK